MSSQKAQQRAIFLMMICATLWSVAGIFIKMIPWNGLVIAGWRSLISAGLRRHLPARHETAAAPQPRLPRERRPFWR